MKANTLFLLSLLVFGVVGCGSPRTGLQTTSPAPLMATEVATDPTLDLTPKMSFLMFSGKSAYDRGEFEKALKIFADALADEIGDRDRKWREEAYVHFAIHRTCKKLRQHAKSFRHLKTAQAIWLLRLGPKHPAIADTHLDMAAEYGRHGDFAKQREYLFFALPIFIEHGGPVHSKVIGIYQNLGQSYQHAGNFGRAMMWHQAQLISIRQLNGQKHPGMIAACNDLAMTFQAQGHFAKSMGLMEKAVTLAEETQPPKEFIHWLLNCNMAAIHLEQPEPNIVKVKDYLDRAEVACRQTGFNPSNDEYPHPIRFNRARLLLLQKDYKKALTLFKATQKETLKRHGTSHPHIALAWYFEACAQEGLGNEVDAKALYHKAHGIQSSIMLPTHPHLMKTKAALEKLRE